MYKFIRAFTMLELIVVVIVVGILSVIVIPNFDRNTLFEASNQIVGHIRYTQHLAMNDDKFNPDDSTWFKDRWTIEFNNADVNNIGSYSGTSWRYSVYSDFSGVKSGNLNSANEVAKNPQSPDRFLSAGWSGISKADGEKVTNILD
ncbi:MAG: prepilin-type N-terminal cleavage/methylation domain-containing protein, partial [Campylobacter sp.]|nr:prepilin-type N-terminal cleavage/methylation domain-containing protein [Campylobacter sp.]